MFCVPLLAGVFVCSSSFACDARTFSYNTTAPHNAHTALTSFVQESSSTSSYRHPPDPATERKEPVLRWASERDAKTAPTSSHLPYMSQPIFFPAMIAEGTVRLKSGAGIPPNNEAH